jgi:membrane protease YdiL (CAAX protease family)
MNDRRSQRQVDSRLHLAVLVCASLLPGAITWLYFCVLPGVTATTVLYIFNKVVQFGLPVLWVGVVLRAPIRPTMPTIREIVYGSTLGLMTVACILGLYFGYIRNSVFMVGVPEAVFAKLGALSIATPLKFAAFGTFLVIGNSAIEEYYWRWFIFGRLRGLVRVRTAIIASSLTFMLHHVVVLGSFMEPEHFWTAALLFATCVGAGGAIWAWAYNRTGSLYIPWLAHLLADVGVIAIGVDVLRAQW